MPFRNRTVIRLQSSRTVIYRYVDWQRMLNKFTSVNTRLRVGVLLWNLTPMQKLGANIFVDFFLAFGSVNWFMQLPFLGQYAQRSRKIVST